ncbi:MAG: ATP-binding cassette domain-containing protein [Chloroflexi bacterium]|nr:ATP-binding cassette domain-containing protein [Chloroflexota bacterium]
MTEKTNAIMQVRNLVKAYETSDSPFVALNEVNLDIYPGEFLGITGKSGAGKTTLLNMISGVSSLTAGKLLFYGTGVASPEAAIQVHKLSGNKLAQWRGQNLGIIYQSFELMPSLSLVKNVMLPPDFSGSYQPVVTKERALELLEVVGLAEHAYKIPAHISGGQKQRVAIARALVNDPPIIIADEPTGNLDTVTAETIFQIFEKLVERGKTVVMVTHDESFSPRFSRRLQIVDGVVSSAAGKPAQFIEPSPQKKAASLGKVERLAESTALAVGAANLKTGKPKEQRSHPAIVLRGVNKIYESAAGKFTALKSIDLQLGYGQFISIVGKSGCGKSTLLNMITGIDHPSFGEVLVGNEHIYKMSESKRALWRGRNLGVVFQFFQLLPTLTLLENTMLPMDYCKMYPFYERPARAMELLELVGLEEQAHKLPTAVSSGQQQCAAIARALATDPDIIVADEPTGNLDSHSADNVLNLFKNLVSQGKTILIVTHDPSITQRTDQTIILSDGEIIDQTVARALPFISHPQMLEVTKQAQKQDFAPNTTIIRQGEAVEHFFMVESGQVEIVIRHNLSDEIRTATFGTGQFFGEIELTQGGAAVASVYAGSDGARVARLPRDEFYKLIDGSPLTRSTIQNAATTRLAENKNRRENDL